MRLLFVSEAFKTAIKASSRYIKARLEVYDYKLTKKEIDITAGEIDTFKIQEGILSSDKFIFGGGISGTFNCEIKDTAKKYTLNTFLNKALKVYMSIELANRTFEEHLIGIYYTETRTTIKGANIKIEAFDILSTLDIPYESSLKFPIAIVYIVDDIFSRYGLKKGPIINQRFYPRNEMLIKSKPKNMTVRQVLIDIAAIAGHFLFSRSGVIDFDTIIGATQEIINNSNAFKIELEEDILGINAISINGAGMAVDRAGGLMELKIPLLTGNDGKSIKDIITGLLKQVAGMTYVPYSSTWQGNFALQCMDKITVSSKQTVVTNYNLNYSGGIKQEISAKGTKVTVPTDSSANQITNTRIDKIEENIVGNVNDIAISDTNLKVNYDSILKNFAITKDANGKMAKLVDSETGREINISFGDAPIDPPAENKWETMAPMPTPRTNLASSLVGTKIYCLGGDNGTGTYYNENESYETSGNTWTTGTPMPTARNGLAAAVVGTKIYTFGGFNGTYLDKVEIMDTSLERSV